RGQAAAQASDWPRAAADLELAAYQPEATLDAWYDLLLARRATVPNDAWADCRRLLDRFESNARASAQVVFACLVTPCARADAQRLVALAQRLAAGQRDASTLTRFGAALYRAGRFEEAARTLQEAIKAHGTGGYADSWLFLALAQQRLGREKEARQSLNVVQG